MIYNGIGIAGDLPGGNLRLGHASCRQGNGVDIAEIFERLFDAEGVAMSIGQLNDFMPMECANVLQQIGLLQDLKAKAANFTQGHSIVVTS